MTAGNAQPTSAVAIAAAADAAAAKVTTSALFQQSACIVFAERASDVRKRDVIFPLIGVMHMD